MEPLNKEQLARLKQKAFPIFEYLQRKEALGLVRQLEKLAPSLTPADPAIQKEFQKLIAKLKWVACPLIQNDQEFFDLIKNHFLEGLELDIDLADLMGDRIALQFGYNIREMFSGIVSAIRANEQEIGSQPITIQGETLAVRPTIKNWLLDFIRSVPTQYPTPLDESNYLFSSPNAKNLSQDEKAILGKVLDFYDNFKTITDQWAMEEREAGIIGPPETPPPISPSKRPPAAPPGVSPPARPTPTPPSEGPPTAPPATPPAAPPSVERPPTAPPSPERPPVTPPPAAPPGASPPKKEDVYQEPISREDITGPPSARKVEPRIEGNIVDLSHHESNHESNPNTH